MSGTAGDPPSAPAQPGPSSCRELFLAFQSLALQGFGGVLPVAQRVLVERRGWLSRAEFLALLSLGQVLPGPNIVNMALIYGDRCLGWRGALSALAGLMLVPLVIVLLLAALVQQAGHAPLMNDALRGMGVVAAGLVLATAIKLSTALRGNRMGLLACAALVIGVALAVGGLRLPLVGVLALVAPLAWAWAWWRLRP
ncbi:MAG: chromate transporter [Rubrivivax sp.]|nr:chromate transporter [Rubrivivax sp.]